MTHRLDIRVYYEDTDLAGIVYYANYLKFIERGRTEALRDLGVDQSALKQQQGLVFVVRRVAVDYLRPARFDDLLTVTTVIAQMKRASLVMGQNVLRGGETLIRAEVGIACMSDTGRPARLPVGVVQALAGLAN